MSPLIHHPSSSARHMTRLRARSPRGVSDETMSAGLTMWGRAHTEHEQQRQLRAAEVMRANADPERTLPLFIPNRFLE